jgi:hypothetical protein
MQEQTKRILSIILFIGSTVAIGLVLYTVFFAEEKTDETPGAITPTEEQTGGALVPSKEGVPGAAVVPGTTEGGVLPQASAIAVGGLTQITALTTGPVQNTTLSANGKGVNFYNNEDGRFYSIDKDGNIVKLSSQTFPDVKTVAWNGSSEKAVLTFPDESKIVYDFQNQTQVTLPKHWDDVNFSPTSNQLIAKSLALDPNNRWLVVSSDNGSNVVPIEALGNNANKVDISWSPNDQVVAFADTASLTGGETTSSFDSKIIYPVGKNQENFKGLLVEGFGFKPSWSPSGKTILYSVYSDYSQGKPLLWLVDGTSSTMGDHRRSMGLNTWVEKCTWSTDTTIYCAVPQNLPENAGLQPTLYADLPDVLYKVDLANNLTTAIAIPATDTTMKNLSVSKDESALYYTDAVTGQLQLIKLK